jgi:hypothetical protein
MLSDRYAACVVTALALCLINENHHRWIQEWYKRKPQYTNENLMTRLNEQRAKGLKNLFCDSAFHRLMGYMTVNPCSR